MSSIIFNDQPIAYSDQERVAKLKALAIQSTLKRSRLCLHYQQTLPTHDMLLVFHQASYLRPHRHPPGKSESYHVVEGSMDVFFFDDQGNIIQVLEMGSYSSQKPFLYRLSESMWHMPCPTSEWLVYHETYTGPFNKNIDVEYAPWAPAEDGPSSLIDSFMERLQSWKKNRSPL